MTSARHQDTGRYTCSGIHKNRPVKTELSNFLHLTVNAKKPKPLMTQVPNVEKLYVGEEVVFSCGVNVSSGWEYLWYKNETRLLIDGNSFSIPSATSSDSSTYKCKAKRGKTIFNTEYSEVRTLHVSEIPVPSLQRKTPWLDVFPTESVKLHCEVKSSSEWNYRWFRGGRGLQADSSMSGGILSIHSASVTDSGEYKCRGRHKSRSVSTKSSSGLTLKVYDEKPIPVLMQNPAYKEMYVGELLSFSCEVNVSSGWEYLWYIHGNQHPNSGSTYAITSAVTKDTAAYKCKAKRGQEKEFHTDFSETLNLDIQVRPRAVMTLLTGWSDIFSTDSLVLRCEVQGSQHLWNYTWLREGQELPLAHSSEHTVTPKDDPNQSQYSCKGIRTGRPSYSTTSDPFKTKNLLLKRRVLLSISGCLFFGIVAVFLGCVVLRVTRKPAELEAKTEEPNLFLTMAELKARDDAPCPFVECISEETLAALPKADGEDNGTVCSETTPLPISSLEDQAVTSETLDSANNWLMSFK
ncbi:B-cell receptor CD22-like isoform 1-T1 [Polymixia lowei]